MKSRALLANVRRFVAAGVDEEHYTAGDHVAITW
jgi:hypothetical protein